MNTLIEEVRYCTHCLDLRLPFEVGLSGDRAFRFPPTIGATGPAALLFVGINPRVSDSNRELHNVLVRDSSAFIELAGNRFRGREYIGSAGLEDHYSAHVRIARQIYPDRAFEEIAAATELFFCASVSSIGLPVEHSPCADKYFERVLAMVQPQIVFAVGSGVEKYLRRRFGSEGQSTFARWGYANRAIVIGIPHPNSRGEKISRWAAAAESARQYLLANPLPSHEQAPATPKLQETDRRVMPKVSYRSTRLHFKRKHVEPLQMADEFEIVTPSATWRMTKADFYRAFPNVLASESYSGSRGEYFYPKAPPKAEPFRVC